MKVISAILLVCAFAPSLGQSAPSGQEKPATTQEMKQQERAKLEQELADRPSIGPYEITDVVKLDRVDGRVVGTTKMGPINDFVRVLLVHDDAVCSFRNTPMGERKTALATSWFHFRRDDFGDPSNVFLRTEILAHPGYLQLVGDAEMVEGVREVTFMDQSATVDEQGEQVEGGSSLRVAITNGEGERAVDVFVKAPDVATLARRHPSEVNSYLRPLLKQFHAESVLTMDPRLAWQVFGMDVSADKQTVATVEQLVKKLDAASFAERISASEELKKLGAPAAVALMKINREALTPEQKTRIDDVLASYQQLDAKEKAKLSDQTAFLLDCMDSPDGEIRKVAQGRLAKKLGRPMEFDASAPQEVREARLDALRQQLLPAPATRVSDEP